jgi:tetratricopeptide (TPR) repeat protein
VLIPATLEVDARVDLAAVHLLLGELDAAQALLEAARTEAPDHSLLLARLAACYVQRQRGRRLFPCMNTVCASNHASPSISNCCVCTCKTRTWQAEALLSAADVFWAAEREHWPASQAALYDQQLRGLRLELWLAREDFACADAWLDAHHAELAVDDYCGLLTGYVQRLAERGRHAQGEDALRRGLRHYPEHPDLYQQHAELAELQGRMPQAIALLHRALHLAGQQQKMTLPLRLKLASVATQSYPALARKMAELAIEEAGALAPSPDMDAAQIGHWLARRKRHWPGWMRRSSTTPGPRRDTSKSCRRILSCSRTAGAGAVVYAIGAHRRGHRVVRAGIGCRPGTRSCGADQCPTFPAR